MVCSSRKTTWPMSHEQYCQKLTEAGIGFDIPQEVAERMGVDCQIEFYLDRDLQGITCEAVARYGDFVFQLVPTAKALRGVINPGFAVESGAHQTRYGLANHSRCRWFASFSRHGVPLTWRGFVRKTNRRFCSCSPKAWISCARSGRCSPRPRSTA